MEEVLSSNSVHCLEADPSIMLARSVPALDYFSIGYFFFIKLLSLKHFHGVGF